MGQAKRRRFHFFEHHPQCCYCGGGTAATTVDHVPAKIMFWGKRRPSGLETPACIACNSGTKKLERAAALFAHIRVEDNRTPDQRQEHVTMARGVSTDFPGWQREFYPVPGHEDAGRLPVGVKPMNVGPLMQDAMYLVAAKLAFALHYHHTGKIVPRTGFVAVRYETNVTIQSRELPADLVAVLGPSQMLTQGEWTSVGHFAYRGAWVPDGTGSVSIAHVGEAFFFLMFAIAQNEGSDEPQLEMNEFAGMRHFRPGDMQRADAVTSGRYNTPLPVYKTSGAASGTLG